MPPLQLLVSLVCFVQTTIYYAYMQLIRIFTYFTENATKEIFISMFTLYSGFAIVPFRWLYFQSSFFVAFCFWVFFSSSQYGFFALCVSYSCTIKKSEFISTSPFRDIIDKINELVSTLYVPYFILCVTSTCILS